MLLKEDPNLSFGATSKQQINTSDLSANILGVFAGSSLKRSEKVYFISASSRTEASL